MLPFPADAVRSVFQPIVDLDAGTVVAYEALARGPQGPWERPDVLFAEARRTGDLAELTHERDRLRDWMWTVPPPEPLDA